MEDKNINILIVDDNENMRKTLGEILKLRGYDIKEAGTGSEAISLAKKDFFHIVLLDVRLPDVEGVNVLKTIREINEDIVVIIMTGYASFDSSVEAINKGAYSYLTKPLNMDQALIIIEKALEKQRLALENKRLLKELSEQIRKLQNAKTQIKTLKGLLPICMYCKRIRNDKQYWQAVESYITAHTEAKFSHGICPDCYNKYALSDLHKSKKSV